MPFGHYSLEEALESVGPGWATLVRKAHASAEEHRVRITQVKEKFGALRIYTSPYHNIVSELMSELEDESMKICEWCGAPGEPDAPKGWIKTLCPSCKEAYINDGIRFTRQGAKLPEGADGP